MAGAGAVAGFTGTPGLTRVCHASAAGRPAEHSTTATHAALSSPPPSGAGPSGAGGAACPGLDRAGGLVTVGQADEPRRLGDGVLLPAHAARLRRQPDRQAERPHSADRQVHLVARVARQAAWIVDGLDVDHREAHVRPQQAPVPGAHASPRWNTSRWVRLRARSDL